MQWFRLVYAAADDNDTLVQALLASEYYENLYETAKDDVRPKRGTSVESLSTRLPGMVEERYGQLYDLESILELLENRYKKVKQDETKRFFEFYQRSLTYAQAKDYAEATDEVQLIHSAIQRVAAVRNLYMGLYKALDTLQFQISNVVKMRCAGLDDASL